MRRGDGLASAALWSPQPLLEAVSRLQASPLSFTGAPTAARRAAEPAAAAAAAAAACPPAAHPTPCPTELGLTDKASWHDRYKHSAYVFAGGLPFELTEGDLLAVFAQVRSQQCAAWCRALCSLWVVGESDHAAAC